MLKRTVFFISDGTGITAETLGHSLMTQFENIQFETKTIPYVDTEEKAFQAVELINQNYAQENQPPLIFATLIDKNIRHILSQSKGTLFEFFSVFLNPLAEALKCQFSYSIGKSHGVHDAKTYKTRIDAINFTLQCDDGIGLEYYKEADLILIGPSRSGKTPTSLYLALQFGLKIANYPLVDEDLEAISLPKFIHELPRKIFGLTISPERLQNIRLERKGKSQYASLEQCQWEVSKIQKIYKNHTIPFLDTTNYSIEEIATKILALKGINRNIP